MTIKCSDIENLKSTIESALTPAVNSVQLNLGDFSYAA